MAQGKQQPKFERNPCIRNRDNCDTDGLRPNGRTTDEFRFYELCWQSSRANNCQKFKFHNYFNKFGRDPLRSIQEFLGENLMCTTFRGDVVWSFFLPYGPMWTNTTKTITNGLDKWWTGSFSQVLRKWVLRTDDGRTDDGRPRVDSSSAVQ